MITISLCMIVKNEEAVLARCLDSVAPLMDEIIIVDTGSTDRTKEIAANYTDKVYDFVWCDDFSAARNFSFSKATMDYIYAPDADEYIDELNRAQFAQLKELLLPEIEIVQMHYITQLEHNTVQNSRNELRPKLFRRLRTFTWIDPIHETVRLDPVVYDSDIEILHLPQGAHQNRDFAIFEKAYARDGRLSSRIIRMYAKELLKCGSAADFANASCLFEELYNQNPTQESSAVLAHYYRVSGNISKFFSVALKNMAQESCSEICYEVGCYYLEQEDYEEAILWFFNAAYETEPVLNIQCKGQLALKALSECYRRHALTLSYEAEREEFERIADEYAIQALAWKLPEDDKRFAL